jgi:hypothetical protein
MPLTEDHEDQTCGLHHEIADIQVFRPVEH